MKKAESFDENQAQNELKKGYKKANPARRKGGQAAFGGARRAHRRGA